MSKRLSGSRRRQATHETSGELGAHVAVDSGRFGSSSKYFDELPGEKLGLFDIVSGVSRALQEQWACRFVVEAGSLVDRVGSTGGVASIADTGLVSVHIAGYTVAVAIADSMETG